MERAAWNRVLLLTYYLVSVGVNVWDINQQSTSS